MFEAMAVKSIPNHVKYRQPMNDIEISNRLRILCDNPGKQLSPDLSVQLKSHMDKCQKHWQKDKLDFLN